MTVPAARVGALTAAFEERGGSEPEGVWAAPGRVNLIGEHTDYNDGFVLPLAIDRRTIAAVARRGDGVIRSWSLQDPAYVEARIHELQPRSTRESWAVYVHGVAWALREAGIDVGGADVVIDSDVPQGSGLSSSAALECSVALALADLHGRALDPASLALVAKRAENEFVGLPTGVMDQMISMLGRAGEALFLDTRSLAWEYVPVEFGAAELRLVVIDTRASRRLATGAYAERRAACAEAARVLDVPALRDASPADVDAARERLGDVRHRRARHVVTENERVLAAVAALRERDFERLGGLLNASHASLRDDYEVSSPELDAAVEAASRAGALGARMTGAGFGGCAIALVAAERVAALEGQVVREFDACGLGDPDVFEVSAADGARRVA